MYIYQNIPTFEEFRTAAENGRVFTSQRDDGYVIFKYTQGTVMSRDWDRLTEAARGIVFTEEGELIALPFVKFFNEGETSDERSLVHKSGIQKAEVLTKLDGSMGMIWLGLDGELNVSTPGSTQSDQAQWATAWLRKQSEYGALRRAFNDGEFRCIVTEIIYPGSKVVVDYGTVRGLHITAAQLPHDGDWRYARHDEIVKIGREFKLETAGIHDFDSFDDIRKLMRDGEGFEGFVLHWPDDGYRLKVKGEWYLQLHRLISNVHPNRVDEVISSKDMAKETDLNAFEGAMITAIREFPEEFWPTYEGAIEMTVSTLREEKEWVDQMAENVIERVRPLVNQFIEPQDAEFISRAARVIQAGEIEGLTSSRMGEVLGHLRGKHRPYGFKKVLRAWKSTRQKVDFNAFEDDE